jgi:transposase-like protein
MKTYPIEKKQDTIALVQEGATIADVANVTGVHERTI